jgi:hypothetical protein
MKSLGLLLMFVISGCSAQTLQGNAGSREIQAEEILKRINTGKHIYVDSCIVWGDLDFTQIDNRNTIAPSMQQAYVEQSVTFIGCVFTGKVSAFDAATATRVVFAHNLSFVRCDFRDEVNFTESVVEGNLFLTGSIFRKKANWQAAYFKHKKAYFNETKFESEALFQNTVFAGDLSFMDAVFDSTAAFQKAAAAGLMMFANVKFNGYVDFSYASAGESVFNYAVFGQRNDFSYSRGFRNALNPQTNNRITRYDEEVKN